MKRTLLLLLIPAVLVSCKQDFLERTPVVGSTEANFYKTPEDALSATIACYNTLQQEVTNIQGSSGLKPHFRWYFGDVISDDTDKGGSGDGDDPQLYDYERFQGNSCRPDALGRMAGGLPRHCLLQPRPPEAS